MCIMAAKAVRVLISGGLAAGGVQTHVTMLSRVLRAAGAEVTVAASASNWPASALDDLRDVGVRVVLPTFTATRNQSRLAKAEALMTWPFRLKRNFDVLYCHGHGRMHLWMRRFLHKDGICIYHELIEAPKPGSMMARVASSMDMIIAPTETIAERVVDALGLCRICVIPFFSTEYPVVERKFAGPPEKRELRVAYFGRLVKHKQPDWLVREWSKIANQFPLAPARLDVYGADYPDDPMLESLRGFVREQGLENQVALHGAYDHNDLSLLDNTDLVLLPSRVEGLPLVLLEAVQHGVPFVAMNAGGIASLLEENPDVMVTPINNADFVAAVHSMAYKLRNGEIDQQRLSRWARGRYGVEVLSIRWRELILKY